MSLFFLPCRRAFLLPVGGASLALRHKSAPLALLDRVEKRWGGSA
jgi:hypothetical protein